MRFIQIIHQIIVTNKKNALTFNVYIDKWIFVPESDDVTCPFAIILMIKHTIVYCKISDIGISIKD